MWVRSLELFLELFFAMNLRLETHTRSAASRFRLQASFFSFVGRTPHVGRGPDTRRRARSTHIPRCSSARSPRPRGSWPPTRARSSRFTGASSTSTIRASPAPRPASSSGQSHSARIAEKYGGRRYFGGGFSDNTLVDLNQSSSEGDVTSGTEYSDYDYVTDERAQQMERGMRGASVPAGIQTRTAVSNRRGRSGSSSYSNMINASTAMIALVVCAVLVALGLLATGAVSTDVVSSMFSVERESLAPQADVSESDDHAHRHRASTRSARDEKEEEEDKVYPVEIGADADAIGPRAAARAAEEAARKRASAKLGDDAKKGARRASSKGASSKRASSRGRESRARTRHHSRCGRLRRGPSRRGRRKPPTRARSWATFRRRRRRRLA